MTVAKHSLTGGVLRMPPGEVPTNGVAAKQAPYGASQNRDGGCNFAVLYGGERKPRDDPTAHHAGERVGQHLVDGVLAALHVRCSLL